MRLPRPFVFDVSIQSTLPKLPSISLMNIQARTCLRSSSKEPFQNNHPERSILFYSNCYAHFCADVQHSEQGTCLLGRAKNALLLKQNTFVHKSPLKDHFKAFIPALLKQSNHISAFSRNSCPQSGYRSLQTV